MTYTDLLSLEPRILYRDALILVIDKPAGIPVHAGPKGGVNLEQGFDALRFGLPQRPMLAHRLDRETSGCLVLGRHAKALRRMGRLFAEGRVKKTYWALVHGAPPEPAGQVDLALRKRSTAARGWWMEPHPDGQTAVTDYKIIASTGSSTGDISWLELSPHTGRTHQIRVHCAALGCPILGDSVYGREGGGLMLHARALSIPLYPAKDPVQVVAEPPAAFRAQMAQWGLMVGDTAPHQGSSMLNILVLCTGNSCRSILLEGILNHSGAGRVRAVSAGSHPTGAVHPLSLATLARHGIRLPDAHSKSWDVFLGESFDLVITVCDAAASETCPVFPGAPRKAHWGIRDPAHGTAEDFEAVFQTLQRRAAALLALPKDQITPQTLQQIGQL